MHDFWATDVLRVDAALVIDTWSFRAVRGWLGEPRTRLVVWVLRLVVLAIAARWVGVL